MTHQGRHEEELVSYKYKQSVKTTLWKAHGGGSVDCLRVLAVDVDHEAVGGGDDRAGVLRARLLADVVEESLADGAGLVTAPVLLDQDVTILGHHEQRVDHGRLPPAPAAARAAPRLALLAPAAAGAPRAVGSARAMCFPGGRARLHGRAKVGRRLP